ncbi:unnamed protein product [Parnassius mnemosyne]|uniref:40S ribosomal protein S15 n=1 Tax=Parnassius mnemosyne TaxID=213953 RepID=A0AAV1KCW1_9NEOP
MFFSEQLMELMHARARRRFARGLKRKPMALVKKLRRAKKEAPPNEKPEIVKTHLRNMIIVPEMVGSIVGIYNGKTFNQVCVLSFFTCLIILYCAEISLKYKHNLMAL